MSVNLKLKRIIDDSYSIIIKKGLLKSLPSGLKKMFPKKTAIILTDSNVDKLYGRAFYDAMKGCGITAEYRVFKAGEKSKTRKTKQKIEDSLLKKAIGRDSYLIALGGGVTGDMGGFIASTYLRGIPYIQIPTSLLAQVDSSVGGKTAVDTPFGKNMIGTFYQPRVVFIDPKVLKTLSDEEYYSGMGEILKHAIMFKKSLADELIKKTDLVINRNLKEMEKIININCAIKAGIVEKDEKENELRKLLNFGHTAAHAIESASKYKVKHGIAVLHGMCIEASIAFKAGLIKGTVMKMIFELIENYLPEKYLFTNFNAEALIKFMKFDKKNRDGRINFVFPEKMGKPMSITSGSKKERKYSMVIDDKYIKSGIEYFLKRKKN